MLAESEKNTYLLNVCTVNPELFGKPIYLVLRYPFQKTAPLFLMEYAGQPPLAKTTGADPALTGNMLPLGRSFRIVSKGMAAASSTDFPVAGNKRVGI
ncbi:hypothetical protein L3C95_30665 [Chitinophaga filiformis]|nr:hypothetical protein [Chitinophaga filiformis]MCF6407297.1 hypothetical protein [Chitinophaga filiformis]